MKDIKGTKTMDNQQAKMLADQLKKMRMAEKLEAEEQVDQVVDLA